MIEMLRGNILGLRKITNIIKSLKEKDKKALKSRLAEGETISRLMKSKNPKPLYEAIRSGEIEFEEKAEPGYYNYVSLGGNIVFNSDVVSGFTLKVSSDKTIKDTFKDLGIPILWARVITCEVAEKCGQPAVSYDEIMNSTIIMDGWTIPPKVRDKILAEKGEANRAIMKMYD